MSSLHTVPVNLHSEWDRTYPAISIKVDLERLHSCYFKDINNGMICASEQAVIVDGI